VVKKKKEPRHTRTRWRREHTEERQREEEEGREEDEGAKPGADKVKSERTKGQAFAAPSGVTPDSVNSRVSSSRFAGSLSASALGGPARRAIGSGWQQRARETERERLPLVSQPARHRAGPPEAASNAAHAAARAAASALRRALASESAARFECRTGVPISSRSTALRRFQPPLRNRQLPHPRLRKGFFFLSKRRRGLGRGYVLRIHALLTTGTLLLTHRVPQTPAPFSPAASSVRSILVLLHGTASVDA